MRGTGIRSPTTTLNTSTIFNPNSMTKQLHTLAKVFCLSVSGFVFFPASGSEMSRSAAGAHEVHSLRVSDVAVPFQERVVSGKISGDDGEALPGANVVVKGTAVGATTDVNGEYRLQLTADAQTLVISYIGYQSKEVSIGNQTRIDVALSPDLETLDEVVVVGYGVQRKSDLTGAITSVKGTELAQLPMQRVDQALQGRAAGVMVLNTSGQPGGQTTIRIRGMNSISGGNQPLIVVDGLQGVDINSLNPNDIESIEILKDASATAIYGSQGANGVILITTRQGKKGKPVVNYTFNQSYQKLAKKLDVMNAAGFVSAINDFRATQDQGGIIPTPIFDASEVAHWNSNEGTDWQEEIYRTAPMTSHQLSLSGATDNVNYMVSGGFLDQEGILINSEFQRFSLRTNVNVKVNDHVNFGLNWAGIKEKGNTPPFGEGVGNIDPTGQVVSLAPRFSPTIPVYDEFGNYSRHPNNFGEPALWNPVASGREAFVENNSMINNLNAFLEFKIIDGLSLRFTGGAITRNTNNFRYLNRNTRPGFQQNGSGYATEGSFVRYQNSNILTYTKQFNQRHNLTVTGVAEQQVQISKGSSITGNNFLVDQSGIFDLGGAQSLIATSYQTKRAINSFLGRVNYSFADKYLFTASYRADGSSVFGANNKWGYFPSASVAWRVSEENFIKDLGSIFTELKVRASWGVTGNQAIAPYASLAQVASGPDFRYPYYGLATTNIGFDITRAANANLKWETTAQTDIGLDFALLNGRLTGSFDYYVKTTDDLLLSRQLPTYTGFRSIVDNVGSTENKGIEIHLGGDPFVGDFKWNTAFNISFNRTDVTRLANDGRLFFRTTSGAGFGITDMMYLREGEPFGQMLGWITEGTWSTDEADQAAVYGQLPGDIKYRDLNDDGRINNTDLTTIGNAMPDFIYGWNNSFSYKNFEFIVLIQGVQGNDLFNIGRVRQERPGEGMGTALLNRWTPDNQDTDVPAFIKQSDRAAAALTNMVNVGDSRVSRWVEDASYLRVKNVTLAYNLPRALIERVGLSRVRVYGTGTNLFTITNYSGYDPEVSSFNNNDAMMGIDFASYPTSRTVTFGLDLTF